MKEQTKNRLIRLLVLLVPTLLLGLPVVLLASLLGVGGLQALLLGTVTGMCHFTFVILVIILFKLEEQWEKRF